MFFSSNFHEIKNLSKNRSLKIKIFGNVFKFPNARWQPKLKLKNVVSPYEINIYLNFHKHKAK